MKRSVLQLVCLLAVAAAASQAQGPATVSGMVRDSTGAIQIGSLVELLGPANQVLATAFTDSNGRYSIIAPVAGIFEIRASAALFLPAMASSLELKSGSHAVVNLTLTTLTDALQWLPAERRPVNQPADEWKWTLRAPADRPLLREFDGGVVLTAGRGQTLDTSDRVSHAHTALLSQSSFADSGLHQVITIDHAGDRETDYAFRADLAPASSQSASATGSFSSDVAPGQSLHTAVNYQWHGATSNDVANALASGAIRFAEVSTMPDGLTLEAGNEMENVTWGGHITAMHPFANLTIAADDGSSVTYSVSTAPGFAQADDVDTTIERPALASPNAKGLTLEHGLHQAMIFRRQGETGMVSITAFHDDVRNPVLQGIASPTALENSGLVAGYDPASGIFRQTGGNYSSSGIAVTAAHRFGYLDAQVAFIDANALMFSGKPSDTVVTKHGNAEMAAFTLRGNLPPTRTTLSASYGQETANALISLDPFDVDAPTPYLNVLLRQAIHGRSGAPGSLEALIDMRNLLAQGYHPFVSPDGETLYLVQVPRTIEGGLAFNF